MTDTPEANENAELSGVDPRSFVAILNRNSKNPKYNVHYGKDKKWIYFERSEIKLADRSSFEILSNVWSKDLFHVYFKEKIVAFADPASAEVIHGQLIDKNYEFDDGQAKCKLNEITPFEMKTCPEK